jgi:ABC-type phosphate transport system substrate-binding protein
MPVWGRSRSGANGRQGAARICPRWWCAALTGLALGLVPVGPAPAETAVKLAVIVNPAVPVTTLGAAELASIFTRATRTWKDGTTVRALNLPQGSPERVEFDRVVLDMSPERSAQYWIDKQIRGEEPAPKAISQADIVARLIPTLSGAIGYVPEDKVDGKARVVARIRGGKVLAP